MIKDIIRGDGGVRFRSALPCGERLDHDLVVGAQEPVSIRAPARGATSPRRSRERSAARFDPRSRAGSDLDCLFGGALLRPVSIRAPARGATPCPCSPSGWGSVSIRAPARGATPRRRSSRTACCRFDPRSRAGSDCEVGHDMHPIRRFRSALPRGERLAVGVAELHALHVSIRAPARGATWHANTHELTVWFRSALPRGERPAATRGARASPSSFDPRSRAGSDGLCGFVSATTHWF